ncbi:MAG: GNAT family N-acetyltransferase [Tumebacillaceae bacterium]
MVTLVPITEEQFADFLVVTIPEYAESQVESGKWEPEEAIGRATDEYNRLLPNGIHTENHYIHTIEDSEAGPVGVLWYAILNDGKAKQAFIYDIRVSESFRGRGFGKQALAALEAEVVQKGVFSIGLHVFGHNVGALRLYESVGYVATNIKMVKKLDF